MESKLIDSPKRSVITRGSKDKHYTRKMYKLIIDTIKEI